MPQHHQVAGAPATGLQPVAMLPGYHPQVCALQWSAHDKELVSSHGYSHNQVGPTSSPDPGLNPSPNPTPALTLTLTLLDSP